MTELLDAVEALTKPLAMKIIRDDGTTTRITHDPLLVQLQDAVTSAIGNGGGGGTATGSVLNDEAWYRLSLIRTQLGDWCRMVDVRPTRTDAVKDLRAWHVAFLSRNLDPRGYTRMLEGWAVTIRDLLDPPKRVPLRGACPVCSADHWFGVDGSRRASPVAVEYDYANPYRSVRAVCRVVGCGTEWTGVEAVEELVAEMTEGDAVQHDVGSAHDSV